MALSNQIMVLALVLSLSLALPSALAGVTCEDLHINRCAFAVSSESKRCVLESMPGKPTEYQCKTSDVVVENISNHIETEACVGACGLERKTIGISSDSLMETRVAQKICSPGCSNNCPNIVDLYSNLASGEGASLSDLCMKINANPRRAMMTILSSGAAPGPVSGKVEAEAPSPSP
ncbi:PAR1 protein [Rhynchospora pubera]|nr:PAR1 protein [Rhynchospora pubera]KAJ4781295.1 PAR1 protein [Rhynchospora pubera]KAJ4788239.1 PAR1 protein [Rhynchospora pubera]KAJ4804535.1 PAR1 protein [Rhynchospora pubera]